MWGSTPAWISEIFSRLRDYSLLSLLWISCSEQFEDVLCFSSWKFSFNVTACELVLIFVIFWSFFLEFLSLETLEAASFSIMDGDELFIIIAFVSNWLFALFSLQWDHRVTKYTRMCLDASWLVYKFSIMFFYFYWKITVAWLKLQIFVEPSGSV